jgi:hypothetical protein
VKRGEAVADFKPGAQIVRVASEIPLSHRANPMRVLSGVTQHLHYTSAAQRERLASISAKEFPASEHVHAVLIPIRKSDVWWNMGFHDRAEFLNGTRYKRGHTAIGEEYAALIYRQLLHSRYLDSSRKPYDFLTYFEFTDENTDWFKALLQKLRDIELNPEWEYVDMEQEIWMRKEALAASS